MWAVCERITMEPCKINWAIFLSVLNRILLRGKPGLRWFFYCIISLKILSKICSYKPFSEIQFRFLLRIKNVKQKKSNFRENFVFIPKIYRTLFNFEYNHSHCEKFVISAYVRFSNII